MKNFRYAFRGIVHVVRTEVNMRVHICFGVYIILAGFVCGISAAQWAAVAICIGAVLAAESFNTAIERLCDEVRPEKNPRIKIVKDASAGAVLCVCTAAAIVGCTIFFSAEKIRAAFDFFKFNPVFAGIIALTLIPAAIFVFAPRGK